MRQFLYLFATGVICSASTYYIAHRAAADAHSAIVVTDKEHAVVRILIAGNEIARFAGTGFYVHGDITYSGALTDTGEAGFAQWQRGANAP